MSRISLNEERQRIDESRSRLRKKYSQSESVAVVIASRRPEDLASVLTNLYEQTLPSFDVLLGLHGFSPSASLKQKIAKLRNRKVNVIVKTFDLEMTLGTMLTELAKSRRAKYVTKMDDDDFYGPEHLHDLLDAIVFHGCEVVGCAMNYIYLEPIDLHLRRANSTGVSQFELFSDWVCGGTIMVNRDAGEKAGWFGTGTTAVDTHLLQGIKRNGGKIWRTFGSGYTYRRRQGDHTYSTNFAKYLNGSSEQWVNALSKVPRPYSRPSDLSLNFKPQLSVTVIIPARGNQQKLDLTLAALALQSYPAKLTKVIVIDDGSTPPLRAPNLRPAKTQFLRFEAKSGVWGKTRVINEVTRNIKSDVLWFLDSDIVVHPDHLAHHMKWHHESSENIVLGWKRFVEDWDYSPKTLSVRIKEGAFDSLHLTSFPHEYFESRVKATKNLLDPGMEGFRALVGATFSMRTSAWNELGGYNPAFTTAEDTELGWRALMHGFSLVPEPEAKSWHLGLTTFTNNSETMFAHNNPNLANWIPELRHLRRNREVAGPLWTIPDQHIVLECNGVSLANFRERIDSFIKKGAQTRFTLLADWSSLDARYSPLDDPFKELRSIHDWYQGDPRIEFAQTPRNRELSIEEILHYCAVDSTPITYYCEAAINEKLKLPMLRVELLKTKLGMVGTVDERGYRAFALYTPALARARRRNAKNLYASIDQVWGVRWESIEKIVKNDERRIAQLKSLMSYSLIRLSKVRSGKDLKALTKRAIALVKS